MLKPLNLSSMALFLFSAHFLSAVFSGNFVFLASSPPVLLFLLKSLSSLLKFYLNDNFSFSASIIGPCSFLSAFSAYVPDLFHNFSLKILFHYSFGDLKHTYFKGTQLFPAFFQRWKQAWTQAQYY